MNSKDGLDEMQRERNNKIGNQMFELMAFALLIDITLSALGIRWLAYPSNIMAIVLTCCSIFLVRQIAAGAFRQPRIQTRKVTVIILIVTIALAFAAEITLSKLPAGTAESTDDYSAYILMVISSAGLLATGIATVIKRIRDKADKDD